MTTTAPPIEASDVPLRRAIRVDGALSTAAGVAILGAAGPVSAATGMSTAVTAAVGAGFALCGATFLALARAANVRPGGVTLAAGNAAFTVVAVVVAAVAAPPLTAAGVVSVLAVGAYTGVIAAAQYRGVRWMSAQV